MNTDEIHSIFGCGGLGPIRFRYGMAIHCVYTAVGPEDEDRLYGLIEIAQRQQAAVQAALDGLAAERVALAREREALARVRDVQIGAQGAVRHRR